MGICCICSCVFRIALGLLNTVLLLAGLLIAALGGVCLGLASSMVLPVILQGILFTILSNLNVVDQTTLDNVATTNWADLLVPTGAALVVVGGVIAGVGAVGYFGLTFTIILKIYAMVLMILVVAESIVVGLFFSGVFNSQLRSAANSSLVNHYVDLNDAGIYSMIWNVIMFEMGCCGLDGYEDFHYIHNNPYPRNDTIKVKGQTEYVALVTPLPCCKTSGSYPQILFTDDYCAVTPLANNSNWNTGCWNEVYAVITQPGVIAVCSLIIVAQGVIAAMAGIIVKESISSH